MRDFNTLLPAMAMVIALGMPGASKAATGPCDLLATGGAPCVAAHSTTRALLGAYSGPLYQLRRSDGQFKDVTPVSAGGVADASIQTTFCAGKTCTISEIYDQSGKANHLKRSLGGGEVCKHQDREAVADALPLKLGGNNVFGIKVEADNNGACTPPAGGEGTGYRLDKTSSIATGDQAETMYMITSGDMAAHGNSGCCFDYGNVETDDKDDGAATMEAIYFGGGAGWGRGGGSGPWVLADMENGVFSGSTNAYTGNTSVPYTYVTAVLIGRSGGTYALLAGNSQSGTLKTMYDGARPNGYTVMKKQGAIVLGTGGDNSDHGKGYFFEGVMTSGAASIATMNQVQANIVGAGYGSSVTSVRESRVAHPSYSLSYDPTRKIAVIDWTQNESGIVEIDVVDLRGSRVATLVNEVMQAGPHQVSWSAASTATGVHLVRFRGQGSDATSASRIILE